MPVDNSKDIVMLLLYSPNAADSHTEAVCGRTRLQKVVYLLQQEGSIAPEGVMFSFTPYKYGPFSKDLAVAIDFLESKGWVEVEAGVQETPVEDEACIVDQDYLLPNDVEDISCSYTEPKLSLTDKGVALAESLYAQLTDDKRRSLLEIKNRYARLPLRELLRYVYTKYPEGAEKSEIKHLVLDDGR